MIIKTEVTPEQRDLIKSLAKAEGKTMTAYLRDKALCREENVVEPLMQYIETQSTISREVNKIAQATLRNKAVYEAEILELLSRMSALEKTTAAMLKEVRTHGNIGKQKHKGNAVRGSKVQQQSRQKSSA